MLATTSLMLAALTNMFVGLWTLHTVLAASGQKTYEVAKGALLFSQTCPLLRQTPCCGVPLVPSLQACHKFSSCL